MSVIIKLKSFFNAIMPINDRGEAGGYIVLLMVAVAAILSFIVVVGDLCGKTVPK
ncbi:MAG TPA: hypothetical protein VMD74_00760 [Candidatus Methylomirabilis sp.]|nr:hypothetical protein [Candidatus Methylomirabilis sp.]